MRDGPVWLSAFLLPPLIGAPLLAHPAFRRLGRASRAILSGGVGTVIVSFSMTVFAVAGVRWSLPILFLASVFLASLLRLALREAPSPPPERQPPGAATRAAGTLAGLAVLTALLATAAGAASSSDLVFFWGAKAQQYAAARTVDARFLSEPFLQYMHAYYPPLVTNLYALASMAAGRMCWTAATLIFPALLAALALGLPGVLRTSSRAAESAAACALIVCAIAYLGMEADIGGNGEMPLLFFETMGIALLFSPASEGAAGQILAGLLLCGAACAKVEGLPFALSAIGLFLWARRGDAKWRGAAAIRLLGPTTASLAAWFTFGATRRLFHGYSDGGGRFLDLHPEHAGLVARAIGRSLVATGYGLPYLIPLLCFLISARRLTRRSAFPLGVAAALIGFLLFTYLHRAEDPSMWISWSAARVFSPVAMLLALAAPSAVASTEGPGPRTERPPRR